MKRLTLLMFLLLITTLVTFGCSKTETTNTSESTMTTTTATETTASEMAVSSTPLSEEDSDFLESVAKDGMAEAELGRDAVSQATDPDVKAFAQKMIDEHSKSNEELAGLAASHALAMPTELEASLKEAKVKLMALTGKSFDQAFIDQMVQDHTNTISKFEEQSSRGADPELKMWVDEKLPKLREHLEEAQKLQTRLKK